QLSPPLGVELTRSFSISRSPHSISISRPIYISLFSFLFILITRSLNHTVSLIFSLALLSHSLPLLPSVIDASWKVARAGKYREPTPTSASRLSFQNLGTPAMFAQDSVKRKASSSQH